MGHSTEFDKECDKPTVIFMPEALGEKGEMGGTMRLGARDTIIHEDSWTKEGEALIASLVYRRGLRAGAPPAPLRGEPRRRARARKGGPPLRPRRGEDVPGGPLEAQGRVRAVRVQKDEEVGRVVL